MTARPDNAILEGPPGWARGNEEVKMDLMPTTKEGLIDKAVSDLAGVENLVRGLPSSAKRQVADHYIGLAREALGDIEADWDNPRQ